MVNFKLNQKSHHQARESNEREKFMEWNSSWLGASLCGERYLNVRDDLCCLIPSHTWRRASFVVVVIKFPSFVHDGDVRLDWNLWILSLQHLFAAVCTTFVRFFNSFHEMAVCAWAKELWCFIVLEVIVFIYTESWDCSAFRQNSSSAQHNPSLFRLHYTSSTSTSTFLFSRCRVFIIFMYFSTTNVFILRCEFISYFKDVGGWECEANEVKMSAVVSVGAQQTTENALKGGGRSDNIRRKTVEIITCINFHSVWLMTKEFSCLIPFSYCRYTHTHPTRVGIFRIFSVRGGGDVQARMMMRKRHCNPKPSLWMFVWWEAYALPFFNFTAFNLCVSSCAAYIFRIFDSHVSLWRMNIINGCEHSREDIFTSFAWIIASRFLAKKVLTGFVFIFFMFFFFAMVELSIAILRESSSWLLSKSQSTVREMSIFWYSNPRCLQHHFQITGKSYQTMKIDNPIEFRKCSPWT